MADRALLLTMVLVAAWPASADARSVRLVKMGEFEQPLYVEWYADERVLLAVGEVHDPRHWSRVEGDAAVARLRLYGRLGARLLAIPFVQPAIEPTGERVRGFLLLAFHVDKNVCVGREGAQGVPADLLAGFVRRYYQTAENAMPPYDSELAGLLERIERDQSVPLLPVTGYADIA